MKGREQQLREYLAETCGLPLIYGETDCAPWTCGWIGRLRGVDIAAPWRGTYRNAAQAAVIVRQQGGMAAFAEREFSRQGLCEVEEPLPGDVGCVEDDRGAALAIRAVSGWAWKCDGTITVADFRLLKAWRP